MSQTLKQRRALEAVSRSQFKRLKAQAPDAEIVLRKRKGPVKVKDFRPLGRIDHAPQPDGPHFDPLDEDELDQAQEEIVSVPIWGVWVFWGLCAISAGFSVWGLYVLGRWLWGLA